MLVLFLRLLCFSLWSGDVIAQIHGANTKAAVIPRNIDAEGKNKNVHNTTSGGRRWHTAYDRLVNGKNNGRAHATSASSWNLMRKGVNDINASLYVTQKVVDRKTHLVNTNSSFNDLALLRLPKDGNAPWRTVERLDTHDDDNRNVNIFATQKRGGQLQNKKRNCIHKRWAVGRYRRNAKGGERKESKISLPAKLSENSVDALPTMWEPQPKPMAQNQSEDDIYELFTLPDQVDSTPFVPMVTRTRRKEVKNPFYPVTAESYGAYAILIISALIFTVGIIGNIAIMCIVCHNYYMRSISNSLLANLALWDFVIIFFCLPLVIFHELTKDWLLGEFSCKIIPYIEVASLGVTTFTLCALCIDRFRAATNVQMYYEMIENCASTGAKLAVIWIGALLLALPELLIRQLVTEDGDPPTVTPCERCVVRISTELPDTLYVLGLTYDGARLWWYFGCYFCLPTLFTIGCSLATARKIRQAERSCVRGNKKQIQLESQMNCTVVALAILYGFCIIPENICNIVSVYMAAGVPRRTLDILHLVSQLLLFCKSAVTPVLLFCLCQPFSRAFLDCCCCCCEECGPPRTSTTATTSDNDNEHECTTTDLELSPFSTIRRETSPYTTVGTHC